MDDGDAPQFHGILVKSAEVRAAYDWVMPGAGEHSLDLQDPVVVLPTARALETSGFAPWGYEGRYYQVGEATAYIERIGLPAGVLRDLSDPWIQDLALGAFLSLFDEHGVVVISQPHVASCRAALLLGGRAIAVAGNEGWFRWGDVERLPPTGTWEDAEAGRAIVHAWGSELAPVSMGGMSVLDRSDQMDWRSEGLEAVEAIARETVGAWGDLFPFLRELSG